MELDSLFSKSYFKKNYYIIILWAIQDVSAKCIGETGEAQSF